MELLLTALILMVLAIIAITAICAKTIKKKSRRLAVGTTLAYLVVVATSCYIDVWLYELAWVVPVYLACFLVVPLAVYFVVSKLGARFDKAPSRVSSSQVTEKVPTVLAAQATEKVPAVLAAQATEKVPAVLAIEPLLPVAHFTEKTSAPQKSVPLDEETTPSREAARAQEALTALKKKEDTTQPREIPLAEWLVATSALINAQKAAVPAAVPKPAAAAVPAAAAEPAAVPAPTQKGSEPQKSHQKLTFESLFKKAELIKEKGDYALAAHMFEKSAQLTMLESESIKASFAEIACYVSLDAKSKAREKAALLKKSYNLSEREGKKLHIVLSLLK